VRARADMEYIGQQGNGVGVVVPPDLLKDSAFRKVPVQGDCNK
jgi:hypothetical protein